ncbi:MAG: molecular chaperone DnaJ [Cyanobacteria bacterium P01_E01_bin.6]
MSYSPFSEDWIQQFSDPYAVMGLPISADDRRVLKRYRSIAKLLHPDGLRDASRPNREFATQLLAKVVNPTYQRLKQEKGRAEIIALLRFRVRRATRDEQFIPQSARAKRLCNAAVSDVEMFYEQAIAQLSEQQYKPLHNFEVITQEMGELNLVYLHLKTGEPIMREKPTGIVPVPPVREPPREDKRNDNERNQVTYAERHYQRAQEYIRKGNCQTAVQELKDALRIDCNQAKYHALMAQAYIMQNLPGAAKAYCRKALKLEPGNRLANACAKRLNISVDNPDQGKKVRPGNQSNGNKAKTGGLFGLFARKR